MIKIVLKFVLAIALIYWLISAGKLDLSLVEKSFTTGPQWIFAMIFIFAQCCLAAYRYKLLLETKACKRLNYLEVFKLNYVGLFFSVVLPGAVTGDLIKLLYVKRLDSNFSKSFLIPITLLDRILGLTGLLFLSGFFSLLYFSEITVLSPKIVHIVLLNLLLFSGAMLFLGIMMAPFKFQSWIITLVEKIPFAGKKIADVLLHLFLLREKKHDIAKSFLISIFIQFLGVLAFWTISSPFINIKLPLQYAFTFIPVGFIANAIPISPGGLGVGHVLFANLFSLVNVNNGASLFNLYFLCNFAINFMGVIPYLLVGKMKLAEK